MGNKIINNGNLENEMQDSMKLFEKTGLDDLAQKWNKILINYNKSKKG
jgi:hypothetical protein